MNITVKTLAQPSPTVTLFDNLYTKKDKKSKKIGGDAQLTKFGNDPPNVAIRNSIQTGKIFDIFPIS